MLIRVYTTPACVQCETTKRYLSKHNISYEAIDLTKDVEAMEKIKSWGYQAVPVVETEIDTWSGFRLDKLRQLINVDEDIAQVS